VAHAYAGAPRFYSPGKSEIVMTNKRKRAKIAIKEQRAAYLFLIPALLGLTFITYVPLLAVFGISLTDLNVGHFIKGGTLPPVKYVGFANFKEIFQNPSIDFLNSIKVTVVFALLAVVCSIIYSMLIAMLLNRKMPGRGFFRAIFYIPYILPATAVMISWWFLLKYDGGLINYILVSLGLGKSMFLSAANTALPSLAMIAVWTSGNLIVIFLAGLQNVPRVYHEAAEIDGANAWQRFWNITIPSMTPIIFYNLLMSLVVNLQVVVPALAVTKGGPGKSTMFMTYLMYQTGFRGRELGQAGAIAFVFFIVAAILAFILFATSKSWIYNEGGDDAK
jgi:multiple sugar transport system permease protein